MYESGVNCGRLTFDPDLSYLRFTVDTPEDFAFASEVYNALHKKSPVSGLMKR
jgi:spore coat polysaccharide biosynthesis protein SpsF (cytidylyltransferase family)